MIASSLASIIERRILINYRVDPDVATTLVPAPLRPQLQNGWAVGGVCLIRVGHARPRWAPAIVGLRSENAAHRISVEWDEPDGVHSGVYIPRRDSGSVVNAVIGGRLFPGLHSPATFDVHESARDMHVSYTSRDGATYVDADIAVAERLVGSALFDDLRAASDYFQERSKGYSDGRTRGRLDGLELRSDAWSVEPLAIRSVRSSYFDDGARVPVGAAVLDSALLMRDVPASWRVLPTMPIGGQAVVIAGR